MDEIFLDKYPKITTFTLKQRLQEIQSYFKQKRKVFFFKLGFSNTIFQGLILQLVIILSSLNTMYYVIIDKDETTNPQKTPHTQLQVLNADLFSQAVKVKQKMRNHSASHSVRHSRKYSRNQGQRLNTAYTIDNSRQFKLTTHQEFTHPWALTPKNRIKTETQRRNSQRMMTQTAEEGENMFGRITIHCLRANRHSLEQRASHLENNFNYTTRKLQHLKWQRRKEQENCRKLKQIRQDSKEQSEILTHISRHLFRQDRANKQRLRQQVLSQRSARQHVLDGVQKEKSRSAYQQRLSAYQLKCEKKEIDSYQTYEKRLICQKEKQSRKMHQRIKSQCLQAKRLQAKAKFRNKWIQQFQLASQAQRKLTQKQHIFASKMQRAIQTFLKVSPSPSLSPGHP